MRGSILKQALAGVAAGAMLFAAGSAGAANYVLNLTGSFLNLQTNSFTAFGRQYDTGVLALSGFTPFELADGDTVEVNVTITDGPFVVPVRGEMFFGLDFSDLTTVNLRLFADLGMQEIARNNTWLRGARVSLAVDNIFDEKVDVRDATGAIPINYQPDLIDPVGRTLRLSFRKIFFPPRAVPPPGQPRQQGAPGGGQSGAERRPG